MENVRSLLLTVIEISTMVLASLILLGLLAIGIIFILDVSQRQQAIRRKLPSDWQTTLFNGALRGIF